MFVNSYKHKIEAMKTYIKIIATLLFSFFVTAVFSQNFYPGEQKYQRPDKDYRQHSSVRTIEIRNNNSYQTNFKFRKGRSYYISVVGNKSENVQFRIIDADTNETLYDNAAYGFKSSVSYRPNIEHEAVIEIVQGLGKQSREKVSFLYAYK
jgi:hypothetical protein